MTLAVAIGISLLVSLTTIPMMAARLIDEHPGEDKHALRRSLWRKTWGAVGDGFEWGFNRVHGAYAVSLAWALDHSLVVVLSLIATIVLNFYLYGVVPKGLFPQQDTGALTGGIQVDQASSFSLTAAKVRHLEQIVMSDPGVQTVTSFVQASGGGMWVTLKPRKQRPGVSADDVIHRLSPRTMGVSGAQLFLQSNQDIPTGGRGGNAQYQYTLQSDSSELLKTWSDKLMRALQTYPDLTEVNTDQQYHALESYITIDRDTASRLGVTSAQIDTTLNDAFGQAPASIIYKPLNQYRVVMEVAQRYQQDPEALKDIYVTPPPSGAAASTSTSPATSASGGGGAAVQASSSISQPTPIVGAVSGVSSSPGGGQASSSVDVATVSGSGATSVSASVAGSPLTFSPTAPSSTSASASSSPTSTGTAVSTTLAGAGIPRTSTGGAVTTATGVAISTAAETMTPLSAIAHWALGNTPLAVNHQGGAAAATLSFNLAPGRSLSDAQRDMQEAIEKIGMPNTVVSGFQGTGKIFQQSLSSEPILILAALLSVYIVLGVLYESFVHPLTVLSTLPSAGVGAVLALLICHIDFSIIAMIGIILLIGIVKKNAIMIIDFALVAEREQGLSSRDAIYQACMLRFRPILMTTCAAIMGAAPLAMGLGEGGEIRRPLGVTIIGGLIASQLLTLLTTPVVYLYLDRLRQPGRRRIPRGLGGAAVRPMPAE